jgi:hypothetical protein
LVGSLLIIDTLDCRHKSKDWTKSEQQARKAVLHNYLNKRAFTLVEDWKDKEELDKSVSLGA